MISHISASAARSSHEILKVHIEIEHQRRSSGVGLTERQREIEPADIHTRCERKTAQKRPLVSAHVGTRLVVVSQRDEETVGRHEINSEHHMAEEVGTERLFFLERLGRGAITAVIIWELPFCEVP